MNKSRSSRHRRRGDRSVARQLERSAEPGRDRVRVSLGGDVRVHELGLGAARRRDGVVERSAGADQRQLAVRGPVRDRKRVFDLHVALDRLFELGLDVHEVVAGLLHRADRHAVGRLHRPGHRARVRLCIDGRPRELVHVGLRVVVTAASGCVRAGFVAVDRSVLARDRLPDAEAHRPVRVADRLAVGPISRRRVGRPCRGCAIEMPRRTPRDHA